MTPTSFNAYSKEMPIEMFYERRSGEDIDFKNKNGDFQIVTLHGLIRAFVSVYHFNPYIVYGTNPANILKKNSDKIFCKEHNPDMYYIASYLFVKFVEMQKNKKFSKHDYVLRYYIIMMARMLMVKSTKLPDYNGKGMKKEIDNIINILKNDADGYFGVFQKYSK